MTDVTVSSWLELQEELFADSWHEALGRHRTTFAYRGRGDAADDLRTSLAPDAGLDVLAGRGAPLRDGRPQGVRP